MLSRAAAGDYPSDAEATWNDLRELGVGLSQFSVYLLTVVLFCVWIYRAYKNLPALGNARQSLQFSPGWAVGYFFIPFVNLVMPYRATKEIWQKSTPVEPDEDPALAYLKDPPALLPAWWAAWLFSNFANNLLFRFSLDAETPETLLTLTKLSLAVGVLNIAAAVLAVLVVKAIDERQEARSRQVTYQTGPPMPTAFTTLQPEAGRPSNA
ncbi:MAG TPA: DUF4328 domain-containing protein, partial [Pyrinomonadaceae bacterium]|nr:DUF4328 domain-containing protein [Pyrinomonadaceae bacterium]